jgi:mediator of RNA polymerase II transcription subunit 23
MNYFISQSNPQRVEILTSTLESLVAKNIIPSRLICEALLTHLDINNMLSWQHGLSLIRSIIGGVDYKGCREVMKLLLDKFDKLQRNIPTKHIPALNEGRKV